MEEAADADEPQGLTSYHDPLHMRARSMRPRGRDYWAEFEWNHIDYPPGPVPREIFYAPEDVASRVTEVESYWDQGYVEGYAQGARELEDVVLGWLRSKAESTKSRGASLAFRYVLSVIEREGGCEEGPSDRFDAVTSDNPWWVHWTKAMRVASERLREWKSYQG